MRRKYESLVLERRTEARKGVLDFMFLLLLLFVHSNPLLSFLYISD